ncbi:hypothetical protein N6H18_16300 [Reichenbachiella agarivorans]|uniref:Uncharacterized protein n=1 Tax=Reichenbachiella agarivorans TaxID=2979464 RepID=A0ABY6CN15_9BACT|nr:hypothetical protein [Reichenbachiella agarivorans]UXP31908.1 hypothetical protein N6H18_16300 [Reichenbachiella agarivorans]
MEELEKEGKVVKILAFIPKAKKTDVYKYPYFSEKDLKASGKWDKKEVVEFKNEEFDYLLSLDKELNKYSKNILATCRAKCRVGQANEGVNEYFEMMINHDDEDFGSLLRQVHHYIKNIRNE